MGVYWSTFYSPIWTRVPVVADDAQNRFIGRYGGSDRCHPGFAGKGAYSFNPSIFPDRRHAKPVGKEGVGSTCFCSSPVPFIWYLAYLCGRQAHLRSVRKALFRFLARVNKAVLPKLWHRDLRRLSKVHMAIAAWRYFVTKNAL